MMNVATVIAVFLASVVIFGSFRIKPSFTSDHKSPPDVNGRLSALVPSEPAQPPAAVVALQDTTESALDEAFGVSPNSSVDGAEAESAGATINVLEASAMLGLEADVQGFVPNVTSNIFSKTLDYVTRHTHTHTSQLAILEAACDSSAFSCEEIIRLVDASGGCTPIDIIFENLRVFEQGRHNTGCILDPANTQVIIDTFERKCPHFQRTSYLWQPFINSDALTPATSVGPPPMQLQTGLRTDKHMKELSKELKELSKELSGYASTGQEYRSWLSRLLTGHQLFESWLKRIRAHGDQFSGPQLVTLVNVTAKNSGLSQAVLTLLQHLGQYVSGVTCEEVKQILRQIDVSAPYKAWLSCLQALVPNIIDGQNKVDIVAFGAMIFDEWTTSQWPSIKNTLPWEAANLRWREGLNSVQQAKYMLRTVGIGLPPKNNPIFGVVEGNPVILVVDESTFMDTSFAFGNDTFTRRKFCHSQLEMVLKGLPDGTYFNVIQYSSTATKIFDKPVLVSEASIDAAMQAMGAAWRGIHKRWQSPDDMIRNINAFALRIGRLKPSTERNAMQALRLAYATAALPSQGQRQPSSAPHGQQSSSDSSQLDPEAAVVANDLPQIYFLTSGLPKEVSDDVVSLSKHIDEFDKGRNIPVNSIGFIMPACPKAKRFVKILASKTGGFFRSIEQASP